MIPQSWSREMLFFFSNLFTKTKSLNFQEEVATQNLSKFRQIQLALENAEERAEVAENSLVRMRGQVVRSATNK